MRSAILFLFLLPLTESRSLKSRSGQWPEEPIRVDLSVPNIFDNIYADRSYHYDGSQARNGRGYITHNHNQPDESEKDADNNPTLKVLDTTHAYRFRHAVVDDTRNYDYTYGDPEVNYDYDVDTGNDKDNDTDDDNEEEEPDDDSKEVVSPDDIDDDDDEGDDDDNNSHDSSGDDRKRATETVTSIIEWLIRNWKKAKIIRDNWNELKADVQMRWRRIKVNMERIKNSLQGVFDKFGKEIQEGLKYCLVKIKVEDEMIEIEASEAIQKLERLLNAGSELVAAFFQLLGEKTHDISSQYINDAEHIGVGGRNLSNKSNMKSAEFALEGADIENGDHYTSSSTNLFEDPEVILKLNLLVEGNILKKEEAEAILKAADQQTQQKSGSYRRRDLL